MNQVTLARMAMQWHPLSVAPTRLYKCLTIRHNGYKWWWRKRCVF